MFTGIVEELGEIVSKDQLADAARFVIRGPLVTTDAGHGDSIAVNGVCLTVVATGETPRGWFDVEISAETVSKTNLGAWHPGRRLNLELVWWRAYRRVRSGLSGYSDLELVADLRLKRADIDSVRLRPHPHEFELYYDI